MAKCLGARPKQGGPGLRQSFRKGACSGRRPRREKFADAKHKEKCIEKETIAATLGTMPGDKN
jgi:hypothetical protein